MKYTTILIFLCIVFFQKNESQAQFFLEGNAGYFSTALLNQNNYGFSEMDYKFTNSIGYGIQIGYAIEAKHQFQTGVRFLTQGQQYTSQFTEVNHEKHVELNYVMIPLTYKIIFGETDVEESYFRAFLSVGGYFSILNDANNTWSISGNEVSFLDFQKSQDRNKTLPLVENLLNGTNDLTDESEFYESADLGATISFGMRYMTSSGVALNFEIIGGYGFLDINAEDWRLNNLSGDYASTNNLFGGVQFGLAYYFKKKHEARSW